MLSNPYHRARAPAVALVIGLCAGCAQYMGYHEEEQVIAVTSSKKEAGTARTLEIKVETKPGSWQPVFEFVAFVERADKVYEEKVVRPIRVRSYGTYAFHNDYVELLLWIFGLSNTGMAQDEKDWHYFCYWPPIDLVARLCGSHGINGIRDNEVGSENYDKVPPAYPLRLAHWFAWILPGHTIFGEVKQKRSAGEPEKRAGTQTTTHRDAAPDVRVKIRTSDRPDETIELSSDGDGIIQWDVSKNLARIGKGTKWSFTMEAQYETLKAELKKGYRGKDIGVTWEKPVLPD